MNKNNDSKLALLTSVVLGSLVLFLIFLSIYMIFNSLNDNLLFTILTFNKFFLSLIIISIFLFPQG